MESVFRTIIVYLFLMLIFRLIGRRALQKINTFDFVLLLIIGSVMKDPLLGSDLSMTHGYFKCDIFFCKTAFSQGIQLD
jgi:uncharacterized membrane protein YcaP (DUF421 family)